MKAILTALALASTTAAIGQSQPTSLVLQPGEALLEIRTTGQALIRPDIASFSIGVVTTGETARAATDANSRGIAAVIAALREAGVERRDIRTRQISVQPRFAQNRPGSYDPEQQPLITGYVAQNNVQLTTRDLAEAPDIVAAAFGAGANSVQGPNLAIEDQAASIAAARTDAIEKARFEAEAYAAGLGMRVARVLRVSERGRSAQPYDIIVTGARMGAAPPPPPPPPPPPAPIEAGELIQTLELWVDYAIVPR